MNIAIITFTMILPIGLVFKIFSYLSETQTIQNTNSRYNFYNYIFKISSFKFLNF